MIFPRQIIAVSLLILSGFVVKVHAQGRSPEQAVIEMTVPEGFELTLTASEPLVRQPVAIDFDDRGRLWVLQYLQYPNPAGLKRVKVDRYSRTAYDRIPEPPPRGPRGADRLTILEDTDGDGRADKATDFLDGLNLATGFTFGHGGVFVLQTPYLLFYPDRNRDDVPDGDPDVLLKGFGMEDTSSLANSLIWGPDGWLYGTQGTNISANIRGIEFEQGIWRYHPVSKQFELFAEGGGNMWGLDFDRHGNLLAGTNYGGYLMLHTVQGAYYQKSFAKHGELHNPFAFGYFEHVPHQNFQGGHVTVGGFLYQGDTFPLQFRDKYIAVDTLGHAMRWHHVKSNGSTFRSENGGLLLQTQDAWFAPSDATQGPDGAVYIADWHDKRTAHPDPDATWDRSNGRIFRLQWSAASPAPHVDPQSLPSLQLVEWLKSTNEWKVRRARRVLSERHEAKTVEHLRKILLEIDDEHHLLQVLWTLNAIDRFDEPVATGLLKHKSDSIRAWTVRLLGDTGSVSPEILQQLLTLAQTDKSPIVISQLASSAKRLTQKHCISIAHAIASRDEFHGDPYIPLLTWWAIEQYAIDDMENVLLKFTNADAWKTPMIRDAILGRLIRRYSGDDGHVGLRASARLLESAPDDTQRKKLVTELDAGLKTLGRTKKTGLPLGNSFAKIAIQHVDKPNPSRRLTAVPNALIEALERFWSDDITDPLILRVMTRLGDQAAFQRTLNLAVDSTQPDKVRSAMLKILQELGDANTCLDPALKLIKNSESIAIQQAALKLLSRFSDKRITVRLLAHYARMSESLKSQCRDLLLNRTNSTLAFLEEIDRGTYSPDEMSQIQLRRIALHKNERIDVLVRKHWGTIRAGTPEEKLAEIRRITNDLRAGSGNLSDGKRVFEKQCATCHQLFNEGKDIGPNLTKSNRHDTEYLLSSIVDPSTQIRKEYLSYVVATKDGRVLTGLLTEQSAAGLTLLSEKNERTTVSRDDIEEMKVSPVSLMPENLLKQLQPQHVRDLFRYLQSSGP